jgi:hypothetical protein
MKQFYNFLLQARAGPLSLNYHLPKHELHEYHVAVNTKKKRKHVEIRSDEDVWDQKVTIDGKECLIHPEPKSRAIVATYEEDGKKISIPFPSGHREREKVLLFYISLIIKTSYIYCY